MAHVATAAFFRPGEWGRQSRVIVAWPSAQNDAYKADADDLKSATKDVSTIAEAVALFEPVTVLVTPDRVAEAEKRFKKNSTNIKIKPVEGYPKLDLWMRDMAPTFVVNDDDNNARLYGVDFNFNGWGGKYPVDQCVSLAAMIIDDMKIPGVPSSIVTEGGSLEVDGEGTILLTESSILNDNRNPGKNRQAVEAELRRALGVEKFLWIPGRKGLEVTDGHIDGIARFVAPGHVILSRPSELDDSVWTRIYREAYDILYNATDAQGRHIEITEMVEADMYSIGIDKKMLKDIESGKEDSPALTYVNYLLVNDGVIFPQFGDKKADAAALKVIRSIYKNREVEPVYIGELPFLGGGIHCSTQEVPIPAN
ncbi:NADPH-dependent 1-acyldihydroxyacetone phosphate reductase [Purpureocillium lavendulum]|uniref:NADPH-dependent 1-acyldihydroxyacetone phosphate reductase n=1 Tax=Purpureocillium lavendulum TaxID=1247861 RepID=A0AB34FHP3_9HYPO|nr:NADPH-dependent 1-acyldihydroxyacetone phosphate reductase [Purpureocillium lavendulum]